MRYLKLSILVALLMLIGLLSAVPITLTFRDTSTATRALIWQEDPTYPQPTPTDGTYPRWKYRVYKSTDDVINPLDINGNPTGDDVLATNFIIQGYADNAGFLNIGPTGGVTFNAPALNCYDPGTNPSVIYHTSNHKIYFRIFNSNSVASATKYIQAHTLYTVLSANATITYVPTYAWSNWMWIVPPTLNPAVLVFPQNGATGLGYAGQTLTWTDGGGIMPTGYKVYFGTDTPPTNIVNGTLQTATTYPTGPLSMNQTYYWKIVPVADTSEVANCPIWSFTTRGEINPEPAINPTPADGATIYIASFPHFQSLSWEPPPTGQEPTGYKLFWNGNTIAEDLGNALSVVKVLPSADIYTWKIVPYYIDPGTSNLRMGRPEETRVNRSTNSRGDAVNCPTWTFTALVAQNFTVDITSTPADADIFMNGVDTGFNTPHQFSLLQGSNATYSVQKTGYNFTPTEYVINNIQSNMSQNFVGSILTYNVTITSAPSGAAIFVDGVNSGQVTPYTFILNHGATAGFTLQLAGYNWNPMLFVVSNLQADASQHFVGTLQTFTVEIISNPPDADIFVNGEDSGFNTPHTFTMNYGYSAIYTVMKTGYTFTPASVSVVNIQQNQSYTFEGTLNTYNVVINSVPTDADIFVNGIDSGFNTPHTFSMTHGSSAVYTVQKPGYTWSPAVFTVTNIQANASQTFTGTLMTFTVDITSLPSDADIFVNGVDSGFNTPYQFVMNYGTSAVYTVQKTGYLFDETFTVTEISSNLAYHFMGDEIFVTVTPNEPVLTHEAGTLELQLTSNYEWSVAEEVDWFTVAPMSGTGNAALTITYETNALTAPRTGVIVVTAGTASQTITITQLGIVGLDEQIEVLVPMINVYPNPFTTTTNIKLHVKNGADAVLDIYSLKGQKVRSLGTYNKGVHNIIWNGKDDNGRMCSSGFYLIRYKTKDYNKTVKVMLMQK